MNEMELDAMGYKRVYDFTSYSHENNINVIPEDSFKSLVRSTFKVIADVLRETYGPYGSTIMISDQNETITTKDGYNIFNALDFSHHYKKKVYLAVQKIIERVNRRVGDGTTTCILLAEKIFNNVAPLLNNPEHKRNIIKVLTTIEDELNRADVLADDKYISPLTTHALWNLIKVAGNYDDELVATLMKALDPVEENGKIVSIRNVVANSTEVRDTYSNKEYLIDYLPGDYRTRIKMEPQQSLKFANPRKVKILLYDHTFSNTAWEKFLEKYNHETPVLIIARSFDQMFFNTTYAQYSSKRAFMKRELNVYITSVNARYSQDELRDLAAVLNTTVRDTHMLDVDWDTLEDYEVSVFKYDCLAIYNRPAPETYIANLKAKYEMAKLMTEKTELRKRIDALSMDHRDATITVEASTSLEFKMISDQIDDCVCIANSAFEYGIVPNLLFYADERMDRMRVNLKTKYEDLGEEVANAIGNAIEEMFVDIWVSKYGYDDDGNIVNETEMKQRASDFYSSDGDMSYDIIHDTCSSVEDLPTSAQYDIEVLLAALSIVKYLLASRALIFDAFLMPAHGDEGHFQRVE